MQNKKCVLICDDDISILDACQLILSEEYRVEASTICSNIVESILQIKPDIILMDVLMPGGGEKAVELIHQTKEIKHIPVILFTALPNVEEINERVNATAILEKPFDINTLKEIVKENIL